MNDLVHRIARHAARAASRRLARVRLRGVTRMGARARVHGAPFVDNLGEILIGDDFVLSSQPVTSHLVTGTRGKIEIGNRVVIAHGAAIASEIGIVIGDDVHIGPCTMILDSDFHGTEDFAGPAATERIVIEHGVRIEPRATILRGARIGRGARVGVGSVVSGNVGAGDFVRGVPARKVRSDSRAAELDASNLVERVASIVSETFATGRAVAPNEGPQDIAGWDSLGMLRLLIAVEDDFGIMLSAERVVRVRTVADLADVVADASASRRVGE